MRGTNLGRITSLLSLVVLVGVFGLTGLTATAQVTTADIVGTVSDQSGAVIPNAEVTVRNEGTGEIRTMTTTSTGEYAFTELQVGSYSISVSAQGFKKFSVPNIALAAGDRIRVDANLQAGAANESIVVQAISPALETDSSASGDMLGNVSVQDLPLNGRNFINLLQVAAGVNAAQPSSLQGGNRNLDRRPTGAYSANGESEFYNDNMVDGLDNNAGGYLALRPSIEGIEEIKILTNNYSADLGRAAGAVVNVVTKSGTNEFHGSAFEFVRNDLFDARDYFARTGSKPELRLNQFGGSIGGPIFKNKTFFFGDVEEFRNIKAATGLYTVPTAYEMAHPGDFSDQCNPFTSTPTNCDPGPVIPQAYLSPIGEDFFNLYPKTGQISGLLANNYQGTTKTIQNYTTADARIDHHFNANQTLFARYAYNPVSTATPSPFPLVDEAGVNGIQSGGSINGISGYNNITTQNGQLVYTDIFKPTLLMELRAGYTRFASVANSLNDGKNVAQAFGMTNVNLPSVPGTSGLTQVVPGGYSSIGDVISEPQSTTWNVYQANGALTYIRGPHTFKFGGAVIHREESNFGALAPVGLAAFDALYVPSYGLDLPFSLEALLVDFPAAVIRENQLNSLIWEYWEPSVYAQDDWHAARHLTLNLGLRYEVFPPNTEKRNRGANFNLSTLNMDTVSTSNSHLGVATGYEEFSPRLGFALELPRQAAIHGGFGMTFYPTDMVNVVGSDNIPDYFYNTTQLPTASLASMVVPTAVSPSTFASDANITSVNSVPRNLRNLYVEQFSLEVQKQFGANVVTIGYVGELGRELGYNYNADVPLPPGGGTVVPNYIYQTQFPNLTTMTMNNNAGTSAYDALRAEFQRRTAQGLTVNANYTWAHGLTDTFSNSSYNGSSGVGGGLLLNDPRYDYGNSDLDIRQRFAASINYEIPFGKNYSGVKGVVLKGWQANTIAYWQTGLPFTVTNGAPVTGITPTGNLPNPLSGASVTQDLLPAGANADRPNLIHSAKVSNPTINEYFDTTAFQLQAVGTAGDQHRDQIYGPRDRRMDLSLFKTFSITEQTSLQFRAECFNIWNISNFATPNNGITLWNTDGSSGPANAGATPNTTTTNLGTISSTNGAEVPRQIQLALKFTF